MSFNKKKSCLPDMDVETAIALADQLLLKKVGKPMNDLQRLVFRGAWQGKSFTEIHQECTERCGLDHLMRNVGPELWKLLSEAVGTKVTKNNLQGPISSSCPQGVASSCPQGVERFEPVLSSSIKVCAVNRSPYESEAYQEIVKPGALIRIKAAQDMGKTWLMEKVLAQARQKGYQTQALSFDLCDSTIFTDLNKFSQWFCASVAQSLGLPNQLSDRWTDIFGCNYNSTLYFETYLLPAITTPFVLALDKVDLVFEHSAIANDFCALLRGWNQRATQGDETGTIWKKLRLIVVHSTEVYGALDINHSPLGGVGLVIKLPEFSLDQVRELTQKYQLDWSDSEVEKLMAIVGGHPYLIQQALSQIAQRKLTLDRLLQTVTTESGVYSDHLRRHLIHLQQQPALAQSFKTLISADRPLQLDTLQAFKLESMGLVHLQENHVIPRCELYRQYFRDRLP
ncbi:AAA-like domain-containing protein [Phormidesmis priestleyi]